jgi:anthranilate synthase/aminodeoxychorismate synthase-like glutamine amidotransferase
LILLIDNYDSFVFNLGRYFERLGQTVVVARNDAIDVAAIRHLNPQAIVLSPGPCAPGQAGCSLDVVRRLHATLPILGVCLGHQTIAAALGAEIVRAREPVHGSASPIEHYGHGIFRGLPSPLTVGRYHSLVVREESLPAELEITARGESGIVMAIAHRRLPVVGVQFHPESILTEHGYPLLANFLRLAGIEPSITSGLDTELARTPERPLSVALRPVGFPEGRSESP